MNTRLLVILAYLLMTLVIGIFFSRRARRSADEFFLAGRGVSKLLLFFTMAATNFSAFTIFGFSGAGYRIGYAFYPVMGFGTGFMALALYLVGGRILRLSRARGYVTPSDFILDRYGSPALKRLFSAVMVVFTLPYLALQAIAGGNSLYALADVPYTVGALLITLFVVLYVSLGGLRSIVWTDLIQGLMMIVFTLAAFALIAWKSGGFTVVNRAVAESHPELFARPGGGGAMEPGIWFGYMFLWFFSVPMAPQMFQRFMAAKNEASLRTTVVFYPIITTFLFFLTVSIGVMGRYTFAGLPRESTDNIFPLLLDAYAGGILSVLLLTGSIAALMSTMDSQLLTLTSIVTLDFGASDRKKVAKKRLAVVLLGAVGFLIAVKPPQTILDFISATTFNGLAVLFPTVVGGLYWKGGNRRGAFTSIAAGETLVVLSYFEVIVVPGVLPVVPIVIITAIIYVAVSLIPGSPSGRTGLVSSVDRRNLRWLPLFLVIFLLGHDFWNWGRPPRIFLGLPLWVWYYFVLGLATSAAFALYFRFRPGAGGEISPEPGIERTLKSAGSRSIGEDWREAPERE